MGLRFRTSPSSETFRIGTYATKSIGQMTIILPTPSQTLPVHVQIVAEDIPLLIRLDVMDRYALQPLVIANALESVKEKWKIPLKRKFGHLYTCWTPTMFQTFYTRPQLERLHKHLLHPSARKLYELLRKSNTKKLPSNTLDTLPEISKACEACVMYSPRQITFQIRQPGSIKFNQRVILDLMFLKDKKRNQSTSPPCHRCRNPI